MKIAIVSSFPSVTLRLSNLLGVQQSNQIAWIASNGQEAVSRCKQDIPDLILMDLVMPIMDGVAATRLIMQTTPCAILVLTTSINAYPETALEAIKAGAIDVLNTPNEQEINLKILINKISAIGRLIEQRSDVFSHSARSRCSASTTTSGYQKETNSVTINHNLATKWKEVKQPTNQPLCMTTAATPHLVAIGASTGGPGAVLSILQELTINFPAPIIVVQHVEDTFLPGLASWFDKQISLTTKIAQHEDYPQRGQVLIAGGNRHLVLSHRQNLRYIDQDGMIYRPSVDLFFSSLAEHWLGKVIAILLTGIGWDGASGLKKLRIAGHTTIAQNQISCVVYGMPKAAIELDAAEYILTPSQIGVMLNQLLPCL